MKTFVVIRSDKEVDRIEADSMFVDNNGNLSLGTVIPDSQAKYKTIVWYANSFWLRASIDDSKKTRKGRLT